VSHDPVKGRPNDSILNDFCSYTLAPFSMDSVVQLCLPAKPYIKKSFEGILMYELAGDYINKFCSYADPTFR
jgi:hypothetical protein